MNKAIIDRYLEESKARGLGNLRIDKYKYTLNTLNKLLGKDFNKVKEKDIIKLISRINNDDEEKQEDLNNTIYHHILWDYKMKNDQNSNRPFGNGRQNSRGIQIGKQS